MARTMEWTAREAILQFGITIYGDSDEELDAEAQRVMDAANDARTILPPEGGMGAHSLTSRHVDGEYVPSRPWGRVRQAIH